MKHLLTSLRNMPFEHGLGVLEPDPPDSRDLHIGLFGWNKYEPKHEMRLLATHSIKDQTGRNTCTFESVTVQKEIDEGHPLSVRSVVAFAYVQRYISGNGFSSLRNSQKAIQKFGALDASELQENTNMRWSTYVNVDTTSDRIRKLAGNNRSETYWSTSDINEIYKLLDEGRIIQCAMRWYSSYNIKGGLSAPYILTHKKGYKVGAHAVVIVGYNQNYHGRKVLIFQNSYGKNWADHGRFYMNVDDFAEELGIYGAYLQKDIPLSIGEFLRDYTNKAVKSNDGPEIYLIRDGKKQWFKNMQAMQKNGFYYWSEVDHNILNQIPAGEIIQ